MKNIKLITAVLLLIAVAPLPYAYYTLLRWVVTGVSAFCAYLTFNDESRGWAFGFAIIAILFNPILPLYMDKSSWMIFDVMTAGVFGFSAFVNKD